jgi:hypothetical protein
MFLRFDLVSLFLSGASKKNMITYLGDEDAIVIELGFENFLVERFCVELIARPSFNWVC